MWRVNNSRFIKTVIGDHVVRVLDLTSLGFATDDDSAGLRATTLAKQRRHVLSELITKRTSRACRHILRARPIVHGIAPGRVQIIPRRVDRRAPRRQSPQPPPRELRASRCPTKPSPPGRVPSSLPRRFHPHVRNERARDAGRIGRVQAHRELSATRARCAAVSPASSRVLGRRDARVRGSEPRGTCSRSAARAAPTPTSRSTSAWTRGDRRYIATRSASSRPPSDSVSAAGSRGGTPR